MTTRTKSQTKNIVFITKAVESMEDPLHEGEYPVYKWSIQMWGEREDGTWEDPSYYISRVAFTLHPSFSQPRRVLSKAPYTVREKGWGEFEIEAELVFTDPDVAHFTMQVPLLFESVNETKATIVFKSVPSSFKQQLSMTGNDAPQQPASQSLHTIPMGLGDAATVSHRIRSLDQDGLQEVVKIVRDASVSDSLVKTVSAEDGSFTDYTLNLYDLPVEKLELISQVLG